MKKIPFLFFFILILISSNFIFSNDSILNRVVEIGEDVVDFAQETSDTLVEIIRRNSGKIDKNHDKIADYLEGRQGIIDAIILFEDFSFVPNKFNFEGITLLNSYSSIPAIHVKIDSSILSLISTLPGIAVVEENAKVVPLLAYSTSQLGVRPTLWDKGETGDGDYSIAIVDSGIDYSHSAFEGRIIASYDAIAETETLVNDNVGHGTHVAGIAAGYPITGNTYTQTARGQLPNVGGFFADILWANVNTSTTFTVGMDWGAQGADAPGGTAYVALVKDNGAGNFVVANCGVSCIEYDTTGYIEKTFTVTSAGDYYVGFGNGTSFLNPQTPDMLDYEGWAELSFDSELPNQKISDGYEEYSGVAPGANIVAVRALDTNPSTGEDSGDVASINAALSWIKLNKEKYNISVVNLSLGAVNLLGQGIISPSIETNIFQLADNGIISVASAGNEGTGSGIFSPASAEEAITVGAVNRYNEIAGYSSTGKISQGFEKPDVVAPGGSYALPFITQYNHESSYTEGLGLIVAPDSNNIGVNDQIDDLTGQQGTSMSAPHIAGLALLLMEQYAEKNGWSWSSNDVFRVKRAILAGTFEVGNIGSAGGETVGNPDQTPSIDRTNKDLTEGWGAVNANAAFGALDKQMIVNQDLVKTFSLEDPFIPNVYAWTTNLDAGKDYAFQATVPAGADVDLLIFDANSGSNGDLDLLFSSTNGISNDELINLNLGQFTEVMLVARMVNSTNLVDDVTIKLTNPEFIPSVQINYPSDGSYVNSLDVKVEFNSVTNFVEAFVDGSSSGFIASGDTVTAIGEGTHNLTLVEENTFLGTTDTDQSNFTIDLTLPTLSSNLTLLLDQPIEDPIFIDYTVTDTFLLDRIEIRTGEIIGSTIQLLSVAGSGVIELNPRSFPPGVRDVEIRVYDKAGNFQSIITSINIIHKTFIVPLSNISYESEEISPLIVIWDAGTNSSSHYFINIDGELFFNDTTWDGLSITVTIPFLPLGDHVIELQIFDENGADATDAFILSIVDNIDPRITDLQSIKYDATYEQTLVFEIIELNPKSIKIYKDDELVQASDPWDGNIDFATLLIEGIPGEINEFLVEVVDSRDNFANSSVVIEWVDNTDPIIKSPTIEEFTQGNAQSDLEWSWIEKFVAKVTLSLDDEIIASINDNSVNSISISKNELNKLSSGIYEFRIFITDTSDQNFAESVDIKVIKQSDGGFLPSFTFIYVIFAILIFNYFKQIKYRYQFK